MTETIFLITPVMVKMQDRMRAIGEVFPVIFFLVAALISLTTMTRMVEEQRTLIGTFKALGYERHSIAGKYMGLCASGDCDRKCGGHPFRGEGIPLYYHQCVWDHVPAYA